MAIQGLTIKDGLGAVKSLTVESGSYGYIPIHLSPPVTTVVQNYSSSFSWVGAASGTFALAINDPSRRSVTIFNPGPNNLYIAISSTGSTTNGFTISDINSAPTYYSFMLYPSGTYTSDENSAAVYYGGYFINGAASDSILITEIK